MSRLTPPFSAEHVGSFLRPPELLAARRAFDAGALAIEGLHAAEDRAIDAVVAMQERLGLRVVTDGEYRRVIYFGHFPAAVSGFTEMEAELEFQAPDGTRMRYVTPVVTGRLRRMRGIATEEYRYLAARTSRTIKVTLPSPCSQHYFRWREGVSEAAYPDLDVFFDDVARVYREELAALAALGARYVQLDDVSLPLLCDPAHRLRCAARGWEPDRMVDRYVALVNAALAGRPAGMTVGIHLCRGNNQGRWMGEGGYEAVAERIFGGLTVDAFFLEYDSPRAGSFEPLRFVPSGRRVVLGLVSTKTPELESPDALRARVEEASRHVALDRLALSPQCGFASTAPGNPLTAADQEAKLRLVVETAAAIWQ